MILDSNLGKLRVVSFVEGISNILLFFVAMPLKYGLGLPQAVAVVGLIHGILFVLYVLLLLIVMIQYKWSLVKGILAFCACIVPFGMLWAEKKLFRN